MSTRALRHCLYGLIALYVVACGVVWPYVPERMPLHFAFTGHVTSWIHSSPVLWFLLPILGAGVVALLLAASRPPEAWNLSREDLKTFRALPAEAQMQIRAIVEHYLLITLMLFVATLMSLQVGVFATALRQVDRMPISATTGMILSLVVMIIVAARGQRQLHSRIRSAATHNEQHTPAV